MVASSYMANRILDKEIEEELMKYTINCEERQVEADVEVDIVGRTESGADDEMVEGEGTDSTESSSSFDDLDYGVEDLDGSEVLSGSRGGAASTMDFGGFDDEIFRMRNKKLTNHWRTFIKPLMWRCKWAELQIKKFEGEAQKYDSELEEYRQQKLVQLDRFTVEDIGVKSLPFSENHVRHETFMRKKRRRDEETEDVTAYMSRHNLFSYYEKGGCFTNDAFMDIELGKSHAKATQNGDDEFWGNGDLLYVDNGDDDDSFLENMFRKIDVLRSRVGKMKSRADKMITSEIGEDNIYPNSLRPIAVDNDFYGSHLDDAAATDDVGDRVSVGTYVVSQLIAEYNSSEYLVPESVVKNRDEVVGDANVRTNRVYFAGPTENEDYGILIDNTWLKERMNNFEELKIQPIQRSVLADSNRFTSDQIPPNMRSILKAANTESKDKRRRGARQVRFRI